MMMFVSGPLDGAAVVLASDDNVDDRGLAAQSESGWLESIVDVVVNEIHSAPANGRAWLPASRYVVVVQCCCEWEQTNAVPGWIV